MSGILYIVATPIGNLSDITLRAIETLKASDVVACEDTRHTQKLMHHLNIHKPLWRYDEHTHHKVSNQIRAQLEAGKAVSLVTDAGTPGISDPGNRLVQDVVKAGFRVIPIPGPSAPIAALSSVGWAGEGFVFMGFLPRRPGRATRLLREADGLGKTVVVLESPFRIGSTLSLVAELWPGRPVVVARELTKIHEEFIRGPVEQVQMKLEQVPPKGEIVLLIGPASEPQNEPIETNA